MQENSTIAKTEGRASTLENGLCEDKTTKRKNDAKSRSRYIYASDRFDDEAFS